MLCQMTLQLGSEWLKARALNKLTRTFEQIKRPKLIAPAPESGVRSAFQAGRSDPE